MSMTVRGVIARSKGAPVEVTDIVVPDPGPGEARVTVQACGVCHTDLHYREGGISDDFPFLLGHEAAGIVESVGEGVTEVEVGDYVVLNWRAVCGEAERENPLVDAQPMEMQREWYADDEKAGGKSKHVCVRHGD